MKRLSLQWRITLLTALLIACACVCMNLILYRTGVTGMDDLNSIKIQRLFTVSDRTRCNCFPEKN